MKSLHPFSILGLAWVLSSLSSPVAQASSVLEALECVNEDWHIEISNRSGETGTGEWLSTPQARIFRKNADGEQVQYYEVELRFSAGLEVRDGWPTGELSYISYEKDFLHYQLGFAERFQPTRFYLALDPRSSQPGAEYPVPARLNAVLIPVEKVPLDGSELLESSWERFTDVPLRCRFL